MTDPLTPDAYAATSGTACPACAGTDLARGRMDSERADTVTRRWACENCGATWTAVYTLTWYDELHVPEDHEGA
jgi:transcriptional regulator NrdR family protein